MARRLSSAPDQGSDPARTPPLVLQIADQLVQDIISGYYTPGEPIREQEIAGRLGASRGPVREALRLCEQDGLVEILPWRGARVVNLTVDEVNDLFEVLSALMGVVARLAAVHSSEEGIAEFAGLVRRLEELVESSGDIALQISLSFEAGAVLRKHCGSRRAGELLMRVGRVAYWQHRFLLDANLTWRRQSIRKYRPILAALIQRDPVRAERAARALVAQSQDFVISRMKLALPRVGQGPSLIRLPGLMQREQED